MAMAARSNGGGGGSGNIGGRSSSSDCSSPSEEAAIEDADFTESLHPLSGWLVQAVRRLEVAGDSGMWSTANETGMKLQGWADSMVDIQDFVQLPTVCPGCKQEMRRGNGRQDARGCSHPTFLTALNQGMPAKDAEELICRHQPPQDCFYALDVLANLVQEEEWMLLSKDGQEGEHLGCLKYYLNQHFLRLVEEGKVVQCFDERGQAQWAVFCTGLVSRGTEAPIYAVLQRCAQSSSGWTSWQLFGFVPLTKLQDPGQQWNKAEAIVAPPEQASFIEDATDLLYMCGTQVDVPQMHPQLWEDLETHSSAFPSTFLEPGISAQGRKQVAMAAVQRAVQALPHNPFTAVPMVHRNIASKSPSVQVQLLLPLKLDPETSHTHLALAVEASKSRRGARMYRITRILSLEQAYMQARVLMPVYQPWLASMAINNALLGPPKALSGGDSLRSVCLPSAAVLQEALEAQGMPGREASTGLRSTLSISPFVYRDSTGSLPSPRQVSGSGLGLSNLASFMSSQQQAYATSPSSLGGGRRSPPVSGPTEGSPYSPSGSSSDRSEPVQLQSFPSSLPGTMSSTGGVTAFHAREGTGPSGGLSSPRLRHSSSLPTSYASGMRRSQGEYHSDPGLGMMNEKKSYSTSSWQFQNFDDPLSPMRSVGRFEGRTLLPLDIPETSNTVQVLSLSPVPGGMENKTHHYSGNLGGHSWGTSGGSMSTALLTTSADGSFSTNGPLSSDHGQSSVSVTMNGTVLEGVPYGSESVERLWNGAIDYDLMASRGDEYVEFTPQDDLCPKLNISQLPPMFVHDFYTGKAAYGEALAVSHFEQIFADYGLVAKVVSREHSKHHGKFFAIVEFQYWSNELMRARLVAGEQICFQGFYKSEEVLIRRHKDKHKVTLATSASLCRPDWKYTGIDTRTGKPLYKGPCSNCTRECTVPFRPVVKGQPPRCRACLPYVMGGLMGATSSQSGPLGTDLSPTMASTSLHFNHPSSHFMEPGPALAMGRC